MPLTEADNQQHRLDNHDLRVAAAVAVQLAWDRGADYLCLSTTMSG